VLRYARIMACIECVVGVLQARCKVRNRRYVILLDWVQTDHTFSIPRLDRLPLFLLPPSGKGAGGSPLNGSFANQHAEMKKGRP
jgi:hypothetical protein